jgi:hypothetical protein
LRAAGRATFDLVARRGAWIVALVFIALTVRLALFLDRYAVNLIYLDQWDFWNGLFDGTGAWTLFRWQHGMQRQGLGNLISAVVLNHTGWNSRAEAGVLAAAMLLAGLAALWLVKRICGRVRPWDIPVPLLFLTNTIVETYIITPNLAHGPLSALYLTTYALSLTVGSHVWRALLIAVINFFAVNTGFTALLGGITPLVLVLFACQPGLRGRNRAVYLTAFVASIATVAHFAHDLVWMAAVTCFQFPADHPWDYIPFAGRIIVRPINPKIGLLPGEPLGTIAAAAAVTFTCYAVYRALRSRGSSPLWNVAGVLMAFTLVFTFTTAVGRVCLGLATADSSRYIPYVLPGLLAVHLVLRCGVPAGRMQVAALAVFVSICVLKESTGRSRREASHESGVKRAWHDCYLAIHNIDQCNASALRPIYPSPEATQLQRKLDWLEARGYNLFQDRKQP